MREGMSFRVTALAVIGFAIAMAYLEAAVVVYLQGMIGASVGDIFPIHAAIETGNLVPIEVGREAATLVMIVAIGALVGRNRLERLAWAAVVFGAWDIGYYAWLQLFTGWPGSLQTTDLLFLIPVPWVGPVWSPIIISAALVGFGIAAALTLRSGRTLVVAPWEWASALVGGLLVVVSYTLDTSRLFSGGLPGPYPWPLFVLGVLLGAVPASVALRSGRSNTATG